LSFAGRAGHGKGAARAPPARERGHLSKESGPVPKKILIAEDSPTMRALIASAIAAMGDYEIVEAANGFEALRILPREKVDMVITDINMPDINGLELVSFIKTNPNYQSMPLLI